jgi:hypothetical protein
MDYSIVASYGDLSASPDLDIGEGFVLAGPAMDSGSILLGTSGCCFLFPNNNLYLHEYSIVVYFFMGFLWFTFFFRP